MRRESMDHLKAARVFCYLIIPFLQLETSSTTARTGCHPGGSCLTLASTPMSKQSRTKIMQFSKSSTRQRTVPILLLSTTVSPNTSTANVSSTIQTTKTRTSVASSSVSISGTQSSDPGCLSNPLGMASSIIPDSDITSSTALNSTSHASEARMGNNAAWIPQSTDAMPWIQVNLQQMKNITGIVTQGWQGSYVYRYYVSYSYHDGISWTNHTVQGTIKVFQANVADSGPKTGVLSPSVTAQFIRVYPIDCVNKCALRMELYGCNVTAGLPGQPSSPTAVNISSNEITVTWNPPTDTGSTAIRGYEIQWKVEGELSHQQKFVPGQTTARLSNIMPYTRYNIQVQAFNEEGGGPWSLPLSVVSAESAPSVPPGNFKLGSSSSLSLNVSWQAIPVNKQNGKLLGYRIFYKNAGSQEENVKVVGPQTLTYKLTGLEFVEYVVKVLGYNGQGDGPATNSLRQLPLEGAPLPPRNLQLTVLSSTSIKATWVEPEKMNGNFKRYVVTYRNAQDNLHSSGVSTTTECVLRNLEEFTEYFVQVHAETSISGNSSAIKQAKTLEDVPSSTPTIDTKETKAEDAHTIRVKWSEITEQDKNGVVLGYTVFYNVAGQAKQLNKTINGDQQTTVIITKLKPFTEYCIKVVGFTKVGQSPTAGQCFDVRTSEAGPSEPRNVVVRVISSTSISVKWTEPTLKNGRISKYIISYGLTKDDFPGKMEVTGSTMEGVISGLMKFKTYYIKVRGNTSLPGNASKVMNATTMEDSPSAPVRFRGQAVSARDILLSWGAPSEPNGIIRYYYIRIYNSKTGQQTNNLVNKSTNMQSSLGMDWSHFISNLKPYRNYTFTVQAVTVSPGDYANYTVMTQEGEPSSPRDATAMFVNGGIIVTWKDPEEYNGILLKYIVYYDGKRAYNSSFQDKGQLVLLTSQRQVSIGKEKLKPGTSYTIYVKASTTKGPGESSNTLIVETPSEAPPPPDDPRVASGEVKPTSITVYLKPSSQSNGKVIAHELVVEMLRRVSKRETDSLPAEIHSYKVAKQNGQRFYIAAWLEGSQLPQVFVLGDGKLYGGYHNAPLQPETKYMLYVRGVTEADGKWIYGEPAAVSLPATGAEPVAKGRDDIVGVIAGVIGALVLAIIVIVAMILYRRSNRPLNANLDVENQKRKRREFELRRLGAKKKPLTGAGDALSEPELPPVMLDQFAKHVTKLHKSDDRGFMIEYTKLDSGREYPSEAAFLQENKAKNRYGNIVAYDHSRVVLSTVEGSPGSDYINASRVDGYNKPNAYIASQGPVPPSFGDFWRMVWEQRSSTIVMLTNLQERHKLKCHKYWPDETEDYGDITVTLVKSEYYSDYKIRTFHVKRESEKEERQVKQFHFTVWPDHGVPEYPTALLAFRRRVRAYNPVDGGPTIVHCSAGVGRTGTYTVIDSMLDRIKAENSLDIFNFVAYLRTRRIAMVQTEEQYTFCHDAILESVQCGNTQIYAHDLRIALARMDEVSTDTKMTRFESEFKTLNKVSPVLQKGSYIVASYPENKEKNRNQEILASDCSRVVLTAIDDNEATSYINAVHISGYKQQHAFIVTQYPLKSTVTDFWRMLCEHDSSCVVLFHANEEEGDFPEFWPETDKATYDDMISVQCLSANRSSVDNLKANYDQSEITEKMVKATDLRTPEKSLRIKMFHFSGWANENEVPSCSALIALTAKVEKWQQHSGNGPITVVCSDGLGRSGTFCALYSVLERLKIEQVVDVFQAIKAMRIPRPGLVRTWTEYRFIHYTVQEYLSAFDDYANFKA